MNDDLFPEQPNPTPPADPDSKPEPKPEPAKATKATAAEDPHAGFAVYDLTLTRYVGSVGKTKKAAEDTVTKVKGHKYETRQV